MNKQKKQDFPNRKVLLFYYFLYTPLAQRGDARRAGGIYFFLGTAPYAAFFSLVRHRSTTVVTTTTLSATTPT